MSFTQDELQAFHTVLEQRLAVQRRELERSLDQRFIGLRREFEQRLLAAQQEIIQTLAQRLAEQQAKQNSALSYRIDTLQAQLLQVVERDARKREQQQQQRFEAFVQSALAAQLLAIEQLLRQNLPAFAAPLENEQAPYDEETGPEFEAIEVQTEIPWEDLAEVVGKVLDDRLTTVNEATQSAIRGMEDYLSARIATLRNELASGGTAQPLTDEHRSVQDILSSIEQLERIIEAMQMAMTSNHTLLSNRLFHHQQLPLERAHPSSETAASQAKIGLRQAHRDRGQERETAEEAL